MKSYNCPKCGSPVKAGDQNLKTVECLSCKSTVDNPNFQRKSSINVSGNATVNVRGNLVEGNVYVNGDQYNIGVKHVTEVKPDDSKTVFDGDFFGGNLKVGGRVIKLDK